MQPRRSKKGCQKDIRALMKWAIRKDVLPAFMQGMIKRRTSRYASPCSYKYDFCGHWIRLLLSGSVKVNGELWNLYGRLEKVVIAYNSYTSRYASG